MFSTFKLKLLLGVYIFILLSIPVGAYLASQQQTVKSSASEQKVSKKIASVTPKPTSSTAKQLLNASAQLASSPKPSPSSSSTPTIATSYGPTLSLKVIFEGRPVTNQAGRLFVGILEGNITTNPKFLLSFNVNLPASGEYADLSLAGLNPGSSYTALLKGPAQLANAIPFSMSPATTYLNSNEPVNLLSGDLNEDNTVNTADYAIMQKALGARSTSVNWNDNADINKDGVINAFDLAILVKNIGQIGASGIWTSPIPQIATPSASLNSPPVGSPGNTGGYWLWLPK